MTLICTWKMDNFKPDKFDIIGAVAALIGVSIIMYAPRK
jgi:small multidrug resistance family-3 protein